jgi:hypothetical protein
MSTTPDIDLNMNDPINQCWKAVSAQLMFVLAHSPKERDAIDAMVRHVFFSGAAAMFHTMTEGIPDGPDELGVAFMSKVNKEMEGWSAQFAAMLATIGQRARTPDEGAKNGEQASPAPDSPPGPASD